MPSSEPTALMSIIYRWYLNSDIQEAAVFAEKDYILYDTFRLSFEEAKAYRKQYGNFIRKNQWKDLNKPAFQAVMLSSKPALFRTAFLFLHIIIRNASDQHGHCLFGIVPYSVQNAFQHKIKFPLTDSRHITVAGSVQSISNPVTFLSVIDLVPTGISAALLP